ncbi:MAG: methionyl-tRNA formyltransferase [Clostridiales bacterium]|nr:methionyl-tRNA formyltransferase [Clostridiales bacterium]
MKVLFMGTPDFAAVCLNRLLSSAHSVVGVVTQPDRAVKRGKPEILPVKTLALSSGITVFQPEKIGQIYDELKSLGADIGVTAAFGQLLPQSVIDVFPKGIINVHGSLLPKYRGASPVQSAIMNGEKETGITIMKTELGLDSGDILAVKKTEIGATETGGELMARLAKIGGELLVETLDNFDGIKPIKQNHAEATVCRTIKKSEQYLDFNDDSTAVVNKIRALSPLPCAKTVISGEVYKLYAAESSDDVGEAGTILKCDKSLVIGCKNGSVSVLKIQAPGKRALDIDEFLRGKKLPIGAVCGKL